MYSLFEIIAVVTAVIVTLVVIVRVLDWVKSRLARREEARFSRRLSSELKSLGQQVADSASWFSEDVPTKKLLEDLGSQIADNGYVWLFGLRDRWREERAKSDSRTS